jgi:hypothetical protein
MIFRERPSNTRMRIVLDSPLKKRGLLALFIALSAYLAIVSIQLAAEWLAGRPQLASLRAAVKLDPWNADHHHRLGRYYDLIARDSGPAIEQYQDAVRLNPNQAEYWLDLASVYQVQGDLESQTHAIEQAVSVEPTSPKVAWNAANLYVVLGNKEQALREFRVVMDGDPYLPETAMRIAWRISPDVDLLLKDVIPARVDSYLAFLALLMSKEETAGTIKVWDALIQLHQAIPIPSVFNYIQYLLLHKSPEDASLTWRQAASLLGLNAYLPSSNNLVVNGDFHLDVLNGGFDWQHQKRSGVSLSLDTTEFHAGHRSLAIVFDGPGVTDAGIYQLITVQPNTTYQFSAYYKSGEMDGAGGPHFSLEDLYSGHSYFLSDALKFGSVWKNVWAEFTTDADTKVLVLRVQRLPAGSPLRGRLWIDDIHLTQKQNGEGSS